MTNHDAITEIIRHARTILATLPAGIDGEGPIRQHLTEIIAEAGSMTMDTTDDAQWWRVEYDTDDDNWSVEEIGGSLLMSVSATQGREAFGWIHLACVHCTRAEAKQAAVDAWAEAGFAHAPKEPPGPTRVERVAYGILRKDSPLTDATISAPFPWYDCGPFPREQEARDRLETIASSERYDWRIVKVAATVSEVEEGAPS